MIRGDKIRECKSSTKPSNPNIIKELLAIINNANPLLKGIEIVSTGFGSEIFPLPSKSMKLARPEKPKSLENLISSKKLILKEPLILTKKSSSSVHSSDYYEHVSPEIEISKRGLKLLAPKQMIRRLPIALAQEQSGNTSENY